MRKLIFSLLIMSAFCACGKRASEDAAPDVWDSVMTAALQDDGVGQLLQVRYLGGSDAAAVLYVKRGGEWQAVDSCAAFVGREGLGKTKEGDYKTPVGEMRAGQAFGILPDPGTAFQYLQVTDSWYACDDDPEYYGLLIDTAVVHHRCHGEHLIAIKPAYNYALTTSYNEERVFGKGCNIFVHCKGENLYTAGCIALDEPVMKHLLQVCDTALLISVH